MYIIMYNEKLNIVIAVIRQEIKMSIFSVRYYVHGKTFVPWFIE